jgi:DNA-binding IclR family transcriptional regulator
VTDPKARKREAAALAERYQSGETIRELVAATGRPYGTVRRLLREARVQFRAPGGARVRRVKAPRYVQIADEIAAKIKIGVLRVDDMVPSLAELARQHKVSLFTVRAATARLQEQGLIYTVPGRGTFVAEQPVK